MRNFATLALSAFWLMACATSPTAPPPREFSILSADGTPITGQVDQPARHGRGVVIMVAGTGAFDRDVSFAAPQGPPALVFADLSQRLTARGLSVVRYDKRGVRYGAAPAERIDHTIGATVTTTTMRDDLAAIYAWARETYGQCVVLFGHSEGMAHIGRFAATDAPAPVAVIGMGAMLESPMTGFRWRFAQRDGYSIRWMDRDGDGVTTNAEVEANLERTPSWVHGRRDAYLHPNGAWDAAALQLLDDAQARSYEDVRATILAVDDNAPWPSAENAQASYQWWKSWFSDDTPIAQHLAHWDTPMIFHYGSVDSQTNYQREHAAGEPLLGSRAHFVLHDDVGHTLGHHVTFGPIDEAIAEEMVDDIRDAVRHCD